MRVRQHRRVERNRLEVKAYFRFKNCYVLEKASTLPPSRFVVYGQAMLIGNSHARKERDVYLLRFGAVASIKQGV